MNKNQNYQKGRKTINKEEINSNIKYDHILETDTLNTIDNQKVFISIKLFR
jgi:hypothetical protein